MRPRLYLDEDVLPELARVLRAHGYDVVSAHEVGARGATDEEQLFRASREARTLFSFNYADFIRVARDWFRTGRRHAGIIVSYRQYRRNQLGEFRRAILALLDGVTAEELADSVFVLEHPRRGR